MSTTEEYLRARITELEAKQSSRQECRLKVSEKGAVSLYGLGRFPVTLYQQQWEKLLGMTDEIKKFLLNNEGELSKKKIAQNSK